MKLRYQALMLSVLAAIELTILVFSSQGTPITQTSISKIGSLEGNYLFFLLGTSALIVMFTLFLHRIYNILNCKPKKELYLIPFLTIIALFFKANNTMSFGRIIHTVLFVLTGILALIVITDLNELIFKDKNTTKKLITAPRVALFGTAVLFIFIGLNVITELVYIGAVLSWINAAGSSI